MLVLYIFSGIILGCEKAKTSSDISGSAPKAAPAPAPEPSPMPALTQAEPAQIAESTSPNHTTNKEGQRLFVGNKTESVKFGMSFKAAEEILKDCNAYTNQTYKPLGIVKMLDCQKNYSLKFVDDKLEEIVFTQSFNPDLPIQPFANTNWNPPSKMRLKMPITEYRALETQWKQSLLKAGFKELFYVPKQNEGKKAKSFYFFELYPNAQENALIRLHFGPYIQQFQASWIFEFAGRGNNQALKEITATYNIYDLNWILWILKKESGANP